MDKIKSIRSILLIGIILFCPYQASASPSSSADANDLNVKEIILEHVGDAYEWHITTWNDKHLSINLPVILYSREKGFCFFSSSRIHPVGTSYQGFSIAHEGENKGKIVETLADGTEKRPWDFSITKNVCSLLISCLLIGILVVSSARWYRNRTKESPAPGGRVGFVEMVVMSIYDEVIKPCAGSHQAEKHAPFLLTAFFFILINNLLGLIPIFPGGANVTGNIAVTMVLALATFLTVNLFGNKEYWKEILWPDVPTWLKAPIPLMPLIEIFGILTKPFSLAIRLFANIPGRALHYSGIDVYHFYYREDGGGTEWKHDDRVCSLLPLHELPGIIGSLYSGIRIYHAFGRVYRSITS